MFFVILVLMFGGLGVLSYLNLLRLRKEETGDADACCFWGAATIVFGLAGGFAFVLMCVVNLAAVADDRNNRENLQLFQDREIIYQKKADAVIGELKGYLAVFYPKYEAEVIESIANNTKLIFKYPELKASDTVMSLTTSIEDLRAAIYDQQLEYAQTLKDMRYKRVNPWLFGFMFGPMPNTN